MVCPVTAQRPDSPALDAETEVEPEPELDVTDGKESTVAEPAGEPLVLASWAVREALRYFEEKLLLEVFRCGQRPGDRRAEICAAHFRSLVESWQPNSPTFYKRCTEFSKQWAPGAAKGCGSPRARPLSAGRLSNYLTRLSRSLEPAEPGGEVDLCTPEEAEFPKEVYTAVQRFGIRLSDIRVTCASVFEACKEWTGLDWGQDHAADPCPWPVPPGFDGLRCSWRQLAAASGHKRIYLNPPWSKLDEWLYKAVCECRAGLPVLAVVPSWKGDLICSDIMQSMVIIDRLEYWAPRRHPFQVQSRVLWDAEFAHPTTGHKMPPLNVMLIWLRCPP